MPKSDRIEAILKVIPEEPGVYQYFNAKNEIIYIGKAKNLKKRVYSYFTSKINLNKRLLLLVKQIEDIKYIMVESESDALLLENQLIKKHQPRYNVLLKDDKTYPWICIHNESFPRLSVTRRYVADGSVYFGPYTSVTSMRALLATIKQLYPLRTCAYALSHENISSGKFKVCLEYHLGNCKAPCIGLQSEDDYMKNLSAVKEMLKGHIADVLDSYRVSMKDLSKSLMFEEANEIKKRLAILENYKSKSIVVSNDSKDLDIFSIEEKQDVVLINYINVHEGALNQMLTTEVALPVEESLSELFSQIILDFRTKFNSIAREIIVPFDPEFKLKGITYTVPKLGDKKKLLDLSNHNLQHYQMRRGNQNVDKSERVLTRLMNDLKITVLPRHIECFDNSNIQGAFPVSSCVVFKNAKPAKRDYRHFNVKGVSGPNDFASMEEVVKRRYSRCLDENLGLPDLIIIDGGKGQLSAAVKVLNELNISGKISIIGIAKKLEEIYFPNDPIPAYLDKKSESLRLIQQIRDEAHRFAITFHRSKRSKNFTTSELEQIKGIGRETRELLLKQFKSVLEISQSDQDKISELIGEKKAKLVYNYFRK
jgi:excinuclease ABC subunit C